MGNEDSSTLIYPHHFNTVKATTNFNTSDGLKHSDSANRRPKSSAKTFGTILFIIYYLSMPFAT